MAPLPRGNEDVLKGEQKVEGATMGFILWLIAVILVIIGIVALIQGSIIWGIVLIVVGLAVGPGGFSIFSRRA
jgi:hypothetical protein